MSLSRASALSTERMKADAAPHPDGGRRVPFLDVGAAYRELRTEIDAAIRRTLESGWYLLGAETSAFERDFSEFTHAARCVGVANGLDALQLSLRALGIEEGAEVIVPSNTFIATWLAVSSVGAVPVPVEPDPSTFTIDPGLIAGAISGRTRAIIPVHLYGHPADMAPILALARARDVKVLEDAAQAHGARYRGHRIGALGDATAWSFYPGKNLGALGDGGAVTTDSSATADTVRELGNYGARKKYQHDLRGVNSRLDELQAAVLGVKLSSLDEWNARRRRIAGRYHEGLRDTGLVLPGVADWAEHVWHLYVVRVPAGRDGLRESLERAGIETVVHYPRSPHLQQAYKAMGFASGDFPLAEAMDREVLSLPIGPHLGDDQVEQVIAAVRTWCRAGGDR